MRRIFNQPRRGFATLVLGARGPKGLEPATGSAVAAAKHFGEDLTVLVVGSDPSEAAKQAAKLDGVKKVLMVTGNDYEHVVADSYADLLAEVVQKGEFKHVVAASSTEAKDVIPRAAAKLDVQPIADVMEIIDESTFKRPTYAGNAIATVRSRDAIKMMTIRPTSFDAVGAGSEQPLEDYSAPAVTSQMKWLEDAVSKSDKPQLTSASRVVSGGRGLSNGENFEKVLQPLCDKLGAAMGASRAAVDAGYVPNELQVGQTGKVVAPELYIAVGISGAIQHLAGMKESKTIVAVNKDPDAAIHQIADYCLVDDLFKAVPEIVKKVDLNVNK